MDQPGKVANPARGQLNRENNIPLSPCVPENLVLYLQLPMNYMGGLELQRANYTVFS